MKISLTVQMTEDDGPADDIVIQNLKDVGFEIETGADGLTRMTYDGEISKNDLAYGASMFKSMRSR